jgi:hypothetical protein
MMDDQDQDFLWNGMRLKSSKIVLKRYPDVLLNRTGIAQKSILLILGVGK